jgi:membrane protease YdiL (CAAX protease family)
MFKKKHDLHYPYTYGETSSLDVFSWFKILSITTFALFFLTVFYNDILKLLPFQLLHKYAIELVILPGIIYLLLNIAGLEWASKDNWKLLFKKVTWKDVWLALGAAIVAIVLALILGAILGTSGHANPSASMDHDLLGFLVNQFETIFQLMGEEFLAIVPFLAFVSLGKYLKWNQTLITVLAVILSSILFGMAHAWAYGGLLAGIQATFVARIILTLTFVKTKNIWVSYFTHYLYDFSIFTVVFLSSIYK